MSWQSKISLEFGERVVTSWRANWELTGEVENKGLFGEHGAGIAKEIRKGFLVLTSQRLLFLQEQGIFGKSYHQVLTVPLPKLIEVSMGGTVLPFISITDDSETYIFHLSGIGKAQFESFRKLVLGQCQARREEIEAEGRKSSSTT